MGRGEADIFSYTHYRTTSQESEERVLVMLPSTPQKKKRK